MVGKPETHIYVSALCSSVENRILRPGLNSSSMHFCAKEFEPGHKKMCLISYANNKGADQPAHSRSLTSAFIVRCLDSIISLDYIAEIDQTTFRTTFWDAIVIKTK